MKKLALILVAIGVMAGLVFASMRGQKELAAERGEEKPIAATTDLQRTTNDETVVTLAPDRNHRSQQTTQTRSAQIREIMKKRIIRISVGVLLGILALIVMVWVLSKTLGNVNHTEVYAGHPTDYWYRQLPAGNGASSNAALGIIDTQVIPILADRMFHDTNDSSVRMSLIKTLNGLPGVEIFYEEAPVRRATAASFIGDLGPAAKSAVPDLIKAVKGPDTAVREAAMLSLGKIRSDPETVIPLLIPYLEDDSLDAPAAKALSAYGSLAKAAVPKLLPLLHAKDDDDQAAAREALLQIDPEAAAKAGIKAKSSKASKGKP